MNDERLAPVFRSWLHDTDESPPDTRGSAQRAVARARRTRQRGRWWPLASLGPEQATTSNAATRSWGTATTWRAMPPFGVGTIVVGVVMVALVSGALLIARPFGRGEAGPAAAPDGSGTFRPTGSLLEPRAGNTSTLLPDGRVLVVGGGSEDHFGSAEIWDPETGMFSWAGSLSNGRESHTATLLPDGRVLVVGGSDSSDHSDFVDASVRTAEVWDPASNTFSPAGSTAIARIGHQSTLLPDGRVLVFGGSFRGPLTAEIWDPATGTFSPAGLYGRPEALNTALADGRILVVNDGGADVWDPVTGTVSPAGTHELTDPGSAALLPDGRVLVIGGWWGGSPSAAVWDPVAASFSPTGSLAEPRGGYLTTVLTDGRVLIAGGCFNYYYYCEVGDEVESMEIWDPDTNVFEPAGSSAGIHGDSTATLLSDGRVFLVGESALTWEPPAP